MERSHKKDLGSFFWSLQRLKRKSRLLRALPLFPLLLSLRNLLPARALQKEKETQKPVVRAQIVTSTRHQNWILGRLSRELLASAPENFQAVDVKALAHLEGKVFFPHWLVFAEALLRKGLSKTTEATVFFTHQQPSIKFSFSEERYILGKARHIITMNSRDEAWLKSLKLKGPEITTIIGGVDPTRFVPHKRGTGRVGFCAAYYARKNPEAILALVKALPRVPFQLLGSGWREAPIFHELSRLANFEYLELPYQDYPTFYQGLDVFVSLSQLEGGPIPLLEAMASNVVPVVSDTGFARDVIDPGKTGYIFAQDAELSKIVELVKKALQHEGDVFQGIEAYSWEKFTSRIGALLY